MNRTEAAAYVLERYSEYLAAVGRAGTDGVGKTLKPAIDDALRALGYTAAEIPTAVTDGSEAADEDLRVQIAYRAMAQIKRDLGAVFNLSSDLGSLSLYQMRQSAEKDLEETKALVMNRFLTLDVVVSEVGLIGTIDLNYLGERYLDREVS